MTWNLMFYELRCMKILNSLSPNFWKACNLFLKKNLHLQAQTGWKQNERSAHQSSASRKDLFPCVQCIMPWTLLLNKVLACYSSMFGKFWVISLIKWLHFHGTNKLKNIYLRTGAKSIPNFIQSSGYEVMTPSNFFYKYCENNQEALLTLPHSLITTFKVLSRIKW